MLKIRLSRCGVNKKPFYRLVCLDSKKKNRGGCLDFLGFWNPRKEILKINKEKVSYWLKKGAFMNKSVKALFTKIKI